MDPEACQVSSVAVTAGSRLSLKSGFSVPMLSPQRWLLIHVCKCDLTRASPCWNNLYGVRDSVCLGLVSLASQLAWIPEDDPRGGQLHAEVETQGGSGLRERTAKPGPCSASEDTLGCSILPVRRWGRQGLPRVGGPRAALRQGSAAPARRGVSISAGPALS